MKQLSNYRLPSFNLALSSLEFPGGSMKIRTQRRWLYRLQGFLFALVLVLSFWGVPNPNRVPQNWVAFSQEQTDDSDTVTSVCSTDSQAVEVEGICFETIVPQTTWRIPENRPDASTPVELGMKITNNSSTPYRFTQLALYPDMMQPDGQALRLGSMGWAAQIRDTDYPLVRPGESKTFLLPVNFVGKAIALRFM